MFENLFAQAGLSPDRLKTFREIDGSLDFGIVSRTHAHRAMASAPLGRMEYLLFAPAELIPATLKRSR